MSKESRPRERAIVRPPKTAERLLLLLLPEQVRDTVCGDLSEIFRVVIVPSCGIFRARLWYWRQVVCSFRLFLLRNPQTASELWKGRVPMYTPTHNAAIYHPGISMHHIQVGGDAAGFLFVVATVLIFGLGIPAFLELLAITGTLGILASGIVVYWHRRYALKIQTLDLHKEK